MSWNSGLNQVIVMIVLGLHALEAVESLSFLDLLKGDQFVERLLANRDDLLDDVPEDAFTERRSRQRALICPPLIVPEILDKGGEVECKGGHITVEVVILVVLRELVKESVVRIRLVFEEVVGDDLEEEAEDAVRELRASFYLRSQVALDAVHDVQLEVEELAVDRVLGRRVEMRLHAVEHDLLVF